jgi:glycosyltransferase involved in cell wall biosynthesis
MNEANYLKMQISEHVRSVSGITNESGKHPPGMLKTAAKQDKRPKILTFVRYYLPGFKSGGPVRTIANMVDQLGDEIEFLIVTSDRDALDTKPYDNVSADSWSTVGKAKVFYASSKSRTFRTFSRLIRETPHDAIYLNSFFNPVFTLYPLLARACRLIPKRPVVIAPRGEFSRGALELKAWKKKSYILAMLHLRVYRNLSWQASSEQEAADIRRTMGQAALNIHVAPDLPPAIDLSREPEWELQSRNGPLRIVFLSRITPMKNLDFAIEALKNVNTPVIFHIYGATNNYEYWQKCKRELELLPTSVEVQYCGEISHSSVSQMMKKYDLFFLPTLGENYGHVIFEALASGVPVLISDRTPWQNLKSLGVGIDMPIGEPRDFAKEIDAFSKMSDGEFKKMKIRSLLHAVKISKCKETIESNKAVFEKAINELNLSI